MPPYVHVVTTYTGRWADTSGESKGLMRIQLPADTSELCHITFWYHGTYRTDEASMLFASWRRSDTCLAIQGPHILCDATVTNNIVQGTYTMYEPSVHESGAFCLYCDAAATGVQNV